MSDTDFRFIEYNPRRAMRGADAVRVAVIQDGEEDWLWMSQRDIAKNMMVFGQHPELVKAAHAAPVQPDAETYECRCIECSGSLVGQKRRDICNTCRASLNPI